MTGQNKTGTLPCRPRCAAAISAVAALAVATLVLIAPAPPAASWGTQVHPQLNRLALRNLPDALRVAMEAHAADVVGRAAAADERKSRTPGESEKHYIDLDRYGPYPFTDVPRDLRVLVERYGERQVRANGLLPWAIVETAERLTAQMRAGDPAMWSTAADLGHYVADANVPLHTTENFNGQKTGNTGAHALFEEVLVEAFWRDQHFTPAPARVPPDLLAAAFETLTASHARIAPFLSAMTKAQERYARTDPRFYEMLWADAGPVVVASMNRAAHDIASFWLAAWERAGRPRLGGAP